MVFMTNQFIQKSELLLEFTLLHIKSSVWTKLQKRSKFSLEERSVCPPQDWVDSLILLLSVSFPLADEESTKSPALP